MEDKKAWLEKRRKGIGGSDVAAICGLSKWKTPLEVYMDKLGLADPIEDNPSMLWGRLLEPIVRQRYADETGREVLVPDEIIVHPKYKHMLANLDGATTDKRVLEVKTARDAREWGEPGTDEIPQYYLLQVQHYMIVTGYEIADVAALIGGSDFRIYEIPADKELQSMIIEAEAEFWDKVQNKIEPDPISFADIQQKFKISVSGKVMQATEADFERITALKDVRGQIKALEDEEQDLKGFLMKSLAEAEILQDAQEQPLITWRSSKPSQRLDLSRFKKEQNELYKEYLQEKPGSRRFLVKDVL